MGNRDTYLRLIEQESIIANRFKNVRRIDQVGGGGQFSLVFTADDIFEKPNGSVVLKFFNPDRSDDYREKCFRREASILEEFSDQKNILKLISGYERIDLNVRTVAGDIVPLKLKFYACEKAKRSVKDYLYSDDNNMRRNIIYFREMCKAVQRIHAQKISHRDLKPDNFLVFKDNYICLSDFGSSTKNIDGVSPLLNSYLDVQIGDPRYVSLEQECGLTKFNEFNFLMDFFAIGANLFELYTKVKFKQAVLDTPKLRSLIAIIRAGGDCDQRKYLFDKSIKSVSTSISLPSIRYYNQDIPKSIACQIDNLYRALVNLDYYKRLRNYIAIFTKINLCEKHIEHYRVYERWKSRRGRR